MPRVEIFLKPTGQPPCRIPILMYHRICTGWDPERGTYYKTQTFPEVFAQHMQYLAENNYTVISLAEVGQRLAGPREDGKRIAVITFDDGFHDFYTCAFPILQAHGFCATVFLPTAFINEEATDRRNRNHLAWGEIAALCAQGVQFGSHTITHRQLIRLPSSEREDEVKKSKEVIENKIGQAVQSFSYPNAFPEGDGKFMQSLGNLLQNAGYQNGVSSRIGTRHTLRDLYFLKRLPMNSGDHRQRFEAKLEGRYDWWHKLQILVKFLKRNWPGGKTS